MAESLAERLRRQAEKELEDLKSDIKVRGKDAAVDFVRSKFAGFPRKGSADLLVYAGYDALLRLDKLTEEDLLRGLSNEQSHATVRAWLLKNKDHGSEAVSAVVTRLLSGEQFPKKRRGPKRRADLTFQTAVKAVAETLNEAGVPLYANEANTRFTAAEAIEDALSKEDDLPISRSLIRDWIS